MTTRDFTANVISASKVVPDGNFKDSKASGVWDINEALDLIKGGNWPNAANINPSAFVDGLFSTDIWTGASAEVTINNGIDFSGSGGLFWAKARGATDRHVLFDTEQGRLKYLRSDTTAATATVSDGAGLKSFNNNGVTLGASLDWVNVDYNNLTSVGWSFRKQPKFFDIVTYTGNGTAGKTVAHNLGSVPGMIMVKVTSTADSWALYHRGSNGGTDPEDYMLRLNTTDAQANNADYWNDTAPTDSVFTVGTDPGVNGNGVSYIAYIFAHNNDDGGFGEPGDQDIIKCGSYTGNGNSTGPTVDLGFEPQWILQKSATVSNTDWAIADVMRGFTADGVYQRLRPNRSDAEGSETQLAPTSTGFKVVGTASDVNTNGETYVYMAIRRGGMQTPTAASDVFAIDDQGESSAPFSISGFPVDMVVRKDSDGGNSEVMSRLLQGNATFANAVTAEGSDSVAQFDFMNGCLDDTSQDTSRNSFMWKRARGYFDVCCYTGTGSARTVSHNLGVAPEMMWVKCRSDGEAWVVYHNNIDSSAPEDYGIYLNDTTKRVNSANFWNDTAPTSSVFTVGTAGKTNGNNKTYVAYLFATVAGISKLGTFTATGSDVNVDCGFTNGSKFVLIKRTESSDDDWFIFRDIASGNDKRFKLNTTAAEATGSDNIDPLSSGFTMTSGILGDSGNEFIFYAVANDPS